MASLGVCVITKNEEETIEKCLNSVPYALEKVVVDSHSQDRTVEIAKKCGAKVIARDFQGFPKEKQFAMDQLNTDWVLVLDADEWVEPELAQEIQEIIKNPNSYDGYRVRRSQIFMNKKLRYGRGVDTPLRLIKKGMGQYNDREAHEEIISQGRVGKTKHELIHHSSPNINERLKKILFEADIELKHYEGQKITYKEIFIIPTLYFLNNLIKKGTWRDGTVGMIFLALLCFQIFLQNAMIFEKNK